MRLTLQIGSFCFLLAICSILSVGCVDRSDPRQIENPELVETICPDYEMVDEYLAETWEDFIRGVGSSEGFYYEISSNHSPTPIRLIGNNTDYAESGENLAYDFKIFNPAPTGEPDTQFRAIILVNQQQIEITEGQMYYDFVLPAQQEATFRAQLPTLPKGMHELVVIFFSNVQLVPSDDFGSTTNSYEGRTTLIVGEAILPEFEYMRAESQGWVTASDRYLTLHLNVDDSFRDWPTPLPTVSTGEPFSFFAFSGYPHPAEGRTEAETSQFALILLKDYLQVPLLGQDVLYLEAMQNESYIQIPLTIIPEQEGRIDLALIRINNPNWLMCRRSTQHVRTSVDARARRVAIEVTAP
ncbi:MAG: hypothetical protein MUF87_16395 [Anaerolineae bacterium]|nr:hypothetical protein [Anaerolineae bacterium]